MRLNRVPGLLILLLLEVLTTGISAQSVDSSSYKSIDRLALTPAVGLITLGLVINHDKTKKTTQTSIQNIIGTTDSRLDDYLQYIPSVGMLAYQLQFGIDQSERLYHLKQYLISGIATQAITYSIKFAANQKRPRGGPRAFPSGHTSFAFSTATVLFHIHKDERPLLAWAFYLPAIATGTMRIMRDDHWSPDVLAGAGIGILTTQLSYMLLFKKKRQNATANKLQNLHFGMTSSGVAITYRLH